MLQLNYEDLSNYLNIIFIYSTGSFGYTLYTTDFSGTVPAQNRETRQVDLISAVAQGVNRVANNVGQLLNQASRQSYPYGPAQFNNFGGNRPLFGVPAYNNGFPPGYYNPGVPPFGGFPPGNNGHFPGGGGPDEGPNEHHHHHHHGHGNEHHHGPGDDHHHGHGDEHHHGPGNNHHHGYNGHHDHHHGHPHGDYHGDHHGNYNEHHGEHCNFFGQYHNIH